MILLDVTILDSSRPGGKLRFEDDPEKRARYARKAFHSSYLVPVTVVDTLLQASVLPTAD